MKRFYLPLILWVSVSVCNAQPIYWITDCTNKTFCLNQGSCNQGEVYLVEKAETVCGSQNILYSYRIDLNNDGSQEIISSEDTVRGNYAVGPHTIIWRASDNCGNLVQCTYLFQIKDCTPPNLICIAGLTQSLDPPICEASFNASQFVLSVTDNCTPNNQLEFGMRVLGSGTGFPSSDTVTFGKCDQGLNSLELLVRDANGLTNQCNVYVIVQNSDPDCACNLDADLSFQVCARSTSNTKLSAYRSTATVVSAPSFSKVKTSSTTDSCFSLTVSGVPFGADYQATIRADKPDAALNGVTTFDLVMISKHILGIEALSSAYQIEAADVNNSNTVTTSDIVDTRKIILGINDTFTHVPSWRFSRPLPNPGDISTFTALVDTYMVQMPNLQADLSFQGFEFVGIKYGDMNFTASATGIPDDRFDPVPAFLEIPVLQLEAGETAEIPVKLNGLHQPEGWQFMLLAESDQVEFVSLSGLPDSDFSLKPQELRCAVLDASGSFTSGGTTVMYLKIRALQKTSTSEAFKLAQETMPAEAYYFHKKAMHSPLELRFTGAESQFIGASPNPFKDQVDFQFTMQAASPVSLEIYDVHGRLVFAENYDLEQGSQMIRLNSHSLPANRVYWYKLAYDQKEASGKLVVME